MNRPSDKGFVLVEMFLVAALLGIVFLAIFSTYTSGFRIWRKVRELKLVEDKRFFISFEKVKRELAGYLRDFDEIEFKGDKETLTFPYVSGLEIVEMSYSFNKGDHCLLRKTTKFSESLKDKMSGKVTKLFDAEDIELAYLFYEEEKDAGGWISSFLAKENGIPLAVRFNITRNGKKFSRFVFIPR